MVFQRNKRIENMREIVFRGKRADTGEWVYGYYYSECGNTYIIVNRQAESKTKRNIPFLVEEDTVGQYTGIKDIDGKKIWEGDIVRYNRPDRVISGKVVWETCYFSIDVHNGTEYYSLTPFCRVIGNIHDNPELLEGEGL